MNEGESAADYAGFSVDGDSDLDGDGLDDLWVSASMSGAGGTGAGAGYLIYGGGSGGMSLADADVRITGSTRETFGETGQLPGDVDGAGYADLAVTGGTQYTLLRPTVYVFSGPFGSTLIT